MKSTILKYIDSFAELLDLIIMKNFEQPVLVEYSSSSFVQVYGLRASSLTLKGIKVLIDTNDFADCYLLIRRIRDNILLDCFLAYDAEHNHADIDDQVELTPEGILSLVSKLLNENCAFEQDDPVKKSIRRWRENKKEKEKWIGYEKIKSKLSEDPLFQELFDVRLKDDLSKMQHATNKYVHALTSDALLDFSRDSQTIIEDIHDLIRILKEFLISCFMLVKSRIFMSDDYMDALDVGMQPQEGSQYWLAPIVHETLWEMKANNESLFQFLQENNSDSMEFLDPRS